MVATNFIIVLCSIGRFVDVRNGDLAAARGVLYSLYTFTLFGGGVGVPRGSGLSRLFTRTGRRAIFPATFTALGGLSIGGVNTSGLFFEYVAGGVGVGCGRSRVTGILDRGNVGCIFVGNMTSTTCCGCPRLEAVNSVSILVSHTSVREIRSLLLSLKCSAARDLSGEGNRVKCAHHSGKLASVYRMRFGIGNVPSSLGRMFSDCFGSVFVGTGRVDITGKGYLVPGSFRRYVVLLLRAIARLVRRKVKLHRLYS